MAQRLMLRGCVVPANWSLIWGMYQKGLVEMPEAEQRRRNLW